jgi:hypothetical protein
MVVGRVLALVAALGIVSVGDAAAQQGCEFVEESGNLRTVSSGGGPITYVSTPNLVCPDGVRIRADSAVAFEASNYVQLLGDVRFEDPDRWMTSRTAEYFTAVGRLQAHGSSELIQKADNSAVRGEEMVYERAGPERALSQLDVRGGRPTAQLYVVPGRGGVGANTGASDVPYDVTADRILLEGDHLFRARGGVEIYRNDLQAFGESVAYDQAVGDLQVMSNARMILNGRELKAEEIMAVVPGGVVAEVEARYDAVLTAEDLRLQAPLVRVFFTDGVMERLVAVPITSGVIVDDSLSLAGPSFEKVDSARPVAVAGDFEIEADSLDMLAPGEVLERINATGSARAESATRDSLNTPDTPPLARTDWMEGDTIVAMFTRVAQDYVSGTAVPDSVGEQYRLDRLMAVGEARSFYRIEPNDSVRAQGDQRPAVHYVTADAITLQLKNGAIAKMEVVGQTEGIHAEPSLIGVPADSLAAPGNTADENPVESVTKTEGGGSASTAPVPGVR